MSTSRILMSGTVSAGAELARLQRRSDNKAFAEMDADTMPALAALRLELSRTTYVGKKGDLLCFLTDVEVTMWNRVTMIVLANRSNPSERQCFIPMNQLWLLIDPDIPDDLRATLANREKQTQAINALAARLYGFQTRMDAMRIVDALCDFAQDFQHAKPPTQMSTAEWQRALAEDDMTLNFNDQAVND